MFTFDRTINQQHAIFKHFDVKILYWFEESCGKAPPKNL